MDGLQGEQREYLRPADVGARRGLDEQADDRLHVRVLGDGRVEQIGDATPREAALEGRALGRRRLRERGLVVRHDDAEERERGERDGDAVVVAARDLVEPHAQDLDGRAIGARAGLFEDPMKELVGDVEMAAQILALGPRPNRAGTSPRIARRTRPGARAPLLGQNKGERRRTPPRPSLSSPARTFSRTSRAFSVGSTIEAAPRLNWLTTSKTRSSSAASGRRATSSRPIRRWASTRFSGRTSAYAASSTRSWTNLYVSSMHDDEPLGERLVERRAEVRGRDVGHERERLEIGPVAEASERGERVLRARGELLQLAEDEVDHVVGEILGADLVHVPGEGLGAPVEHDQMALVERPEELEGEEGIAGGLLVNQIGEPADVLGPWVRARLPRTRRAPASRAGPRTMSETRTPVFLASSSIDASGCAGPTSLSRYAPTMKRLRTSGCVAKCKSSARLAGSAHCRSSRKSTSGCSFWRKDLDEAPKNHLKAVLRRGRGHGRDGRLLADDELDLRDDVDDELRIDPERGRELLPQVGDHVVALAQGLEHELLERRGDGAERDSAFVLIELARAETAALAHDGRLELVDERGFADPRVPVHRRERGLARRDDALEGREELSRLGLPAVELLRELQSIRHVARAERERVDPPARQPSSRQTHKS